MGMREDIEKMRRDAIRLDIAGEVEHVVGGTRFGGVPDVPEGFEWPVFVSDTYDDCEVKARPLAFVAQFHCAELKKFDRENLLPETGVLSFFYEMSSMRWGFDPKDEGCCRVYWFEDVKSLAPAHVPDSLEEDYRFPSFGITAGLVDSFPAYGDFSVGLPFDVKNWDAYEAACKEMGIAAEAGQFSRLIGWPEVLQNNMTTECELISRGYYLGNTWKDIPQEEIEEAKQTSLEEWRLLFQLDTVEKDDFELMFGDCGSIYFYIRKDDLKARRFDRVWMILQCF